MKTDDLIALVSKDVITPMPVSTAIARWLPIGVTASGIGFAFFLGLRAHLGDNAVMMAVGMKVIAALLLAATGFFAALRLASPGTSFRTIAPALVLAPAFMMACVMFDLVTLGFSGLPARVMGMSALRCLIVIPLLAAFPLVAVLFALRNGATVRPVATGAAAGMTAAGVAAAIYAFNCADDSPLFVLAWYGLAALLLAGIGALTGKRVLAW